MSSTWQRWQPTTLGSLDRRSSGEPLSRLTGLPATGQFDCEGKLKVV